MGKSYFIWNGVDCRSMGVITQGAAPIIRPEERVKHIEIPGVSGDLTQTEGEAVYNSYIQTLSIAVRGGMRVREIYRWLRGSGWVTFSGEPDRRQKARIIGAITLNRHSRNIDAWEGEIQFYCQPLKELLRTENVTITTNDWITNRGDVIAKPLYKVTTNATAVYIDTHIDGEASGTRIDITGVTSGSVIWIDSETMEVWNSAKTATITGQATGDFPVLHPGKNVIYISGCASVEIDKRERYL